MDENDVTEAKVETRELTETVDTVQVDPENPEYEDVTKYDEDDDPTLLVGDDV